jgi:hypothetical protein
MPGGPVVLGTLLPIVPILLLPFILIFFVVVFPLWAVALGVLGFLLVVLRGLNWVSLRVGSTAVQAELVRMRRVFRWVLTFGGLAEKVTEPKANKS